MHKDKAELERIKREVAKSTVEKAVNECTRLTNIYDKKREELERQHEEVRQKLEEERAKVCIPDTIHSAYTGAILFFLLYLLTRHLRTLESYSTPDFLSLLYLFYLLYIYFFSTSNQEDMLRDKVLRR